MEIGRTWTEKQNPPYKIMILDHYANTDRVKYEIIEAPPGASVPVGAVMETDSINILNCFVIDSLSMTRAAANKRIQDGLRLAEQYKSGRIVKIASPPRLRMCECGAASVGSGVHSGWCPKA